MPDYLFILLSSGLYFARATTRAHVNGEEYQRGRRENMEKRRRSRAGQEGLKKKNEMKESISKCHCQSFTALPCHLSFPSFSPALSHHISPSLSRYLSLFSLFPSHISIYLTSLALFFPCFFDSLSAKDE